MNAFVTSKGTTLPIMKVKGKDYLEVKYRLIWFREDHPEWSIETEFIELNPEYSTAKATIKDEKGRVIATSHKYEDKQGFGDHKEKSETGAIGRALALIGYGTQFCADDLSEGERIVDAPIDPKQTMKPVQKKEMLAHPKAEEWEPSPNSEYIIPMKFKKFGGKRIKDVKSSDLASYIAWLENNQKGPATSDFLELKRQFELENETIPF